MSKTLNKYIKVLDYAEWTLLVLSDASSNVFLWSVTNVVGVPVGMTSASISQVFLAGNEILTMYLKTMGKKRNKHRKIVLLTKIKLSEIENNIQGTDQCWH